MGRVISHRISAPRPDRVIPSESRLPGPQSSQDRPTGGEAAMQVMPRGAAVKTARNPGVRLGSVPQRGGRRTMHREDRLPEMVKP